MSVSTPIGVPLLRRARSGWFWLVVALAFLAVGAILLWPRAKPGTVDPEDARPGGGQALAQVLRHNGIDVRVVRDRATLDALAAAGDAATTTLVLTGNPLAVSTDPNATTPDATLPVTRFGNTVLAGVDTATLNALGLPDGVTYMFIDGPLERRCSDPDLGQAQAISKPSVTFTPAPGWVGCFGTSASFAVLSRGSVNLVSDSRIWRNDTIVSADNAALGLRLLGRQPHVVWYVPSPPSTTAIGNDTWTGGIGPVLPRFVEPAMNLLVATAVVLLLWRGRRLGRLVREPLPAEVKSLETTFSRARLYQRAGDRSHALAILQRAARRRLATRLGLPASTADQDAVNLALAVAQALPPGSDTDPQRIHHLLTDPTVANDADLVAASAALLELEKRITP